MPSRCLHLYTPIEEAFTTDVRVPLKSDGGHYTFMSLVQPLAGCFACSDVMKNAVWITSGHTALNMT